MTSRSLIYFHFLNTLHLYTFGYCRNRILYFLWGMASKFAWFATEMGRKVVQSTTCALGIVAMGAQFATHTLFLEKYRAFVQMYRQGVEEAVPKNVMSLYDEVIKDMKFTKYEQLFLKPFMVYGFDMFHAGSTKAMSGALIGIPINISYEKTYDVDRDIKAVKKGIDWESETGEQLQEALVLSDRAKKFAIAREMSYARTYYLHAVTVYPALCIYMSALLAERINQKMGMFKRPPILRFALYTMTTSLGVATYFFLKDFTTVSYDHAADEGAADLGRDYVEGGIEFYDKLLKRNMVLRTLMGADGEKLYSTTGNQNVLLRQKSMPLVQRKIYLEDRLKSIVDKGATVLDCDSYVYGTRLNEETSA